MTNVSVLYAFPAESAPNPHTRRSTAEDTQRRARSTPSEAIETCSRNSFPQRPKLASVPNNDHDDASEAHVILDRFRLDDQVAVVTGAGRGLGAAIAVAFAVHDSDARATIVRRPAKRDEK